MLNIPVEIINLLKADTTNKNIRVRFPNGEHPDITNANIVSESLTFTESICSQSELKFGLCENSVLQFETFGIGKIKGYEIECLIEIICSNSVSGSVYREDLAKYVYPISMGIFKIDSCKKQADMTHRTISAYSEITNTKLSEIEYLANAFNQDFYWKNNNLRFSLETLIKLTSAKESDLEDLEEETSSVVSSFQYEGNQYTAYYDFSKFYLDAYSDDYENYAYGFKCYEDNDFVNAVNANEIAKTFLESNDELGLFYAHSYTESVPFSTDSFSESGYTEEAKKFTDFCKFNILPYINIQESGEYLTYSHEYTRLISHVYLSSGYMLRCGSAIKKITIKNSAGEIVFESGPSNRKIKAVKYGKLLVTSNDAFSLAPTVKSEEIELVSSATFKKTSSVFNYDFSTILASDLKSIIEAYNELHAIYGRPGRNGEYENFILKDKFESDAIIQISKNDYSDLWYDDDFSKPIGRLICTFKDADGTEHFKERILVDDYSVSKYATYSITSNYFIQNFPYTLDDIGAFFTAMSANISSKISYMPMEISMKGRPDIEAGDVFKILVDDIELIGLVEKRTLSGIQKLVDSYTSESESADENDSGLKSSYDAETGILTIYT